MKKIFFLGFFGLLLVFSVSAQTSVDSFLGSWKLVKHSFDTPISNSVMNVNIAQNGNELKLEQFWKNTDTKTDWNKTLSFKGYLHIKQIGGSPGRIEKSQIRFLNAKKFYIQTTTEILNTRKQEIRETWSISDDGKSLIIERALTNYDNSRFGGSSYYSKTVYSKL